jgi:hypothetical protein
MRRKLGTKTKGERSEQLLSAAKAEGAGEHLLQQVGRFGPQGAGPFFAAPVPGKICSRIMLGAYRDTRTARKRHHRESQRKSRIPFPVA